MFQRNLESSIIPQLFGSGIGSFSISIEAHDLKSNTFLTSGHGIVGIKPDRLIKTSYGLIILALVAESDAFFGPGHDKIRVLITKPTFCILLTIC